MYLVWHKIFKAMLVEIVYDGRQILTKMAQILFRMYRMMVKQVPMVVIVLRWSNNGQDSQDTCLDGEDHYFLLYILSYIL